MCLPVGFLSFIAKTCTIYLLGFSLYCVYKYISSGYLSHLLETMPIIIILFIFLLTGICSCVGLNKKYFLAGICTFFMGSITFVIVFMLNSSFMEYFDFSKGCTQLLQANPIYELFIDPSMDKYFDETSSLLCTEQCPCKWLNKTEVYTKNPSRFKINKYTGAKSAIECPGYLDDIQFQPEKKQVLQTMIQLEVHGCSGYCQKKDIFSITDINMGVPKYNCFDVARHLQRLQMNSVMIGLYFMAFVLVILIPSTCCLFFQYNRETANKEKMYERVQQLQKELGPVAAKNKKKILKSTGNKTDDNNVEPEEGEEEEEENNDNQENKSENKDSQEEQGEGEQNKSSSTEPIVEKSASEKKDD